MKTVRSRPEGGWFEVMEEERKHLLLAGICLGDITLALAATADVLPPYAAGLDAEGLLAGCGDADAVRERIEKELPAEPEAGTLPPEVLRTVLDRAVAGGKFLSAIRCLEMLGERDSYVERHLDKARKMIREDKAEDAARALVVAANLDLPDGIPAFQYTGPGLHDACTATPENCITRMERENAVLRALKYLLPSDRVHQVVSDLSTEERERLLGFVARERDPRISDFMAGFEKAHNDLADAKEHAMAELTSRAGKVEEAVGKFAGSLGAVSAGNREQKEVIERLRRNAGGLKKELGGLGDLVRDRQFRRLMRRLEQFVESREEIEQAAKTLGGGASGSVFDPMLNLIREIGGENILEQVKGIEERLLSGQVTMLGRSVHSHEHWQYLRELAFKYPVSPLVCCVAKINDRWMAVPVWESPVAQILRTGLDGIAAGEPAAPPDEDF